MIAHERYTPFDGGAHMRQEARMADPDALMREVEAAELIGLTPRALQAWRAQGRGPRFVRISTRAVRYRRRDILEWIEARMQATSCVQGGQA